VAAFDKYITANGSLFCPFFFFENVSVCKVDIKYMVMKLG